MSLLYIFYKKQEAQLFYLPDGFRFMHQVTGEMTTPAPGVEADVAVKPGPLPPDAVPPCFPGIPPTTHPTLPELKQPPAQPQGILSHNVSVQHTYC